MRFLVLIAVMIFIAGTSSALAVHPDEQLEDPVLEARARVISQQLRCLQCQNQTIDDSDAQIAIDLRRLVRKKLKAGQNDQEIIDYVHQHYGDFVLMTPPVKPTTYGLWFMPFIVLVIGCGAAFVYLRRQTSRFSGGDGS